MHAPHAAEIAVTDDKTARAAADGAPGREDTFEGDGEFALGATRVRYFGDYELRRVLGRGGMGIVYGAQQMSLNRPVALKMIRAGLWADSEEVRRFQNEAEAVANLDHPGIVPVFEVGQHKGRHYFSMKRVEGPSLDKVLNDYVSKPKEAARLMAEVARAVHHAHQRGILHRDLKPSNILLDGSGAPHVTDFGLARRIEGDSSLSVSGAILGTPQFMSPEQASGTRRGVTTATDVYGLGAVLYALLSGRPPFRGETVIETLEQVRKQSPEPLSKFNLKVPRDLEVIALKCLDKDPARRYGSAHELAQDLDRFVGGEPILARRTGLWERAGMWARRKPAVAGLVAASMIAAVASAGLAVAVPLYVRTKNAEQVAVEQRTSAQRAAERAENFEYLFRIALAERYWREGSVVLARDMLTVSGPLRRYWEWHYLDRLLNSSPNLEERQESRTLGQHEGSVPAGRAAHVYCRLG
jgi:serine/threonine-protein kinase